MKRESGWIDEDTVYLAAGDSLMYRAVPYACAVKFQSKPNYRDYEPQIENENKQLRKDLERALADQIWWPFPLVPECAR